MAIVLTSGIVPKNVKGKVGDVVFAKLNKETTVRAYQPKVFNPRTPAQMLIRRKFRAMNHCISRSYADTFKRYGIKLPGYNAYTSVSRMVFNNLVTKSIGYPHNYLPELPKNNQRLLAFNTDVKGEIFEYLAFRAITTTGQGGSVEVCTPGFSIPKDLDAGIAAGPTPISKYFGSNIAFTSLDVNVMLMGVYHKTLNISGDALQEPIINPTEWDSGKIFSSTDDGVSTRFKYVYKADLMVVNDPKNSDNWFVYFATGDVATHVAYGARELDNLFISCSWPGVSNDNRCGATMFLFSKPFEALGFNDGVIDDSAVSFDARECIIAVNDWTGNYTVQG